MNSNLVSCGDSTSTANIPDRVINTTDLSYCALSFKLFQSNGRNLPEITVGNHGHSIPRSLFISSLDSVSKLCQLEGVRTVYS